MGRCVRVATWGRGRSGTARCACGRSWGRRRGTRASAGTGGGRYRCQVGVGREVGLWVVVEIGVGTDARAVVQDAVDKPDRDVEGFGDGVGEGVRVVWGWAVGAAAGREGVGEEGFGVWLCWCV